MDKNFPITITTADVSDSYNKRYVTDAMFEGISRVINARAGGDLYGTYPNPFIRNGVLASQTLDGFVSGAGTVTSSDTILTAIEKLDGNINAITSGGYVSLAPSTSAQSINGSFNAHMILAMTNTNSGAGAISSIRVINNTGDFGQISMISTGSTQPVGSALAAGNFVVNSLNDIAFFGSQSTNSTAGAFIFAGGTATANTLAGFLASGYNWFSQLNRFGDSSTATAIIDILAGSTTIAPLKIGAGSLLTTPISGMIENDGTAVYYTDNTNTRYSLLSGGGGAVLSTVLAGLNTSTATIITSSDTVLSAFGKLQGQINAIGPSGSLTYISQEIPSGSINSINVTFTTIHTPDTNSEMIFLNGLLIKRTVDYTISGTIITFTIAPTTLDDLRITYTYASSTNYISQESPSGSVNGINVIFVLSQTPTSNSEMVFLNGLLIKRTVDYTISGTTLTFTSAPTTGDDVKITYLY